jgi:ABC-type nickel/cobalt efflux system permease component RcnA
MTLAEGIRRLGFRKWYERTLLTSHAHLALTFLCLIGVFGAFEAARRFANWHEQVLDYGAVLLFAGSGVWALRRYLFLLQHAELAAHQAECPHCKAYGRLELILADSTGEQVQVRCRGCGHGWTIDNR